MISTKTQCYKVFYYSKNHTKTPIKSFTDIKKAQDYCRKLNLRVGKTRYQIMRVV